MAIPSSWGIDTSGFTKPYREAGTFPGSYATQVNVALRRATAAPAAPAAGGMNAATLAAIKRAKAYYRPGGGFGKGVEAGLERGRVKAMASGMQHLVGAGLAGTTMAGGLGKRYEEEVGAPTRLSVEEQRAQALSGIEMAQAGMGFQAGQAGAQRSLQLYMAQLQADSQGQEMARRDRPTVSMAAPTGGGYARQFPSIYGDAGGQAVPDWTGGGGGVSGVVRPGARQYDLPGEDRRFDTFTNPMAVYGAPSGF